jgi:HK97 family phage prohead protease
MANFPLARFKSMAKKGESLPVGSVLHKQMTTVVEALDDRRVRFTISNASVDRDNDTVSVEGWELGPFLTNPVVLWGHNSYDLPVGKCVEIGVENSALKAIVEFVPADVPCIGDRAEAILRMCRTGFLNATSVGFRPLDFEIANDRGDDDWFPPVNFLRQELMEFSIVSIPANPEALIDPGERIILGPAAPTPVVDEQQLSAQLAEEELKLARSAADRARRQRAVQVLALG